MGRYDTVPTGEIEVSAPDDSRRVVRYYLRREIAAPADHVELATHVVSPYDRLDLISARYIGDPLAFWRIADANAALDPDGLVDGESVGSELIIPAPVVPGG